MGFIDNIKKKFQESVNKMAQPQQQAEQPQQMSIADRFKQFLNSKNTMSTMIRSNPVLRQNAVDRFKQFSQRQQQPQQTEQQQEQQQTATQNIQGAERVNLPTNNKTVGLTANNTGKKQTTSISEEDLRKNFKKANPNATDEEVNNAVARLKAGQKGDKVQVGQAVAQSNANDSSKNEILKTTKQYIDAQTPQQAIEDKYDTGYEFKRDRNGNFKLQGKMFKEPELITDLKKMFQVNTRDNNWNPETIAEFVGETKSAIGQSIGATADDTLAGITKGVAGMGEGIDDFKNYAYAQIIDWTSNLKRDEKAKDDLKSYAEDIRQKTSETGDWVNNIQDWQEEANEGSTLGQKGQQVTEGIGSSVPTMALELATGGLGKVGEVASKVGMGLMRTKFCW
jgi:hypothetical protein